jgi:uncharacterized protein YceK
MAVRAICIALLLASLLIAGCGTAANLARQKPGAGGVRPFGGVRQDVSCIRNAVNRDSGVGAPTHSESGDYPRVVLMLACAADLPFSLVGDIATWPYTVAYSFINQPVPSPLVVVADPLVPAPVPTPPTVPPMPIPTPPGKSPAAGVGKAREVTPETPGAVREVLGK